MEPLAHDFENDDNDDVHIIEEHEREDLARNDAEMEEQDDTETNASFKPEDEHRREEEDDDDDEEDECRVCRGPAEEGRPLLQPCKCSGSMGMVHQECLISWLEVTRGDGRCEICKYKFCFDPQYAENTPDRLPAHEVILGLSSRFLAKWLPLALRVCFAALLWLVVAPYLTNCLYLGWIIRPSSIMGREETVLTDIVSGAVMGATIIISFLSLMSFADFLRVLWQQPPGGQQQQQPGEDGRRRDDGRENDPVDADDNDNNDDELDDYTNDKRIIDFIERKTRTEGNKFEQRPNDGTGSMIDPTIMRDLQEILEEESGETADANDRIAVELARIGLNREAEQLRNRANELRNLAMQREARQNAEYQREDDDSEEVLPLDDEPMDYARPNIVVEDIEDDDDSEESDEEDEGWLPDEADDSDDDDDEVPPLDDIPPFQPLEDRGVEFDPLDPALPDDQVDMEINVALDELLGLRGPISTLVRNLLWLLAFNATYLGIFGFVPKTVGTVIYSSFFNTTLCDSVLKSIPYVSSEDQNQTTVISLLLTLEEESQNRNTTFKLSDFATVTLGYLSMASFIILSRYAIVVLQRAGKMIGRTGTNGGQNLDDALHFQRIHRVHNLRRGLGEGLNDLDDEDPMGGIGDSIETALDATVAIIKVCVLLFMKMFLLPLSLGLCLDASTLRLFGHDVADRLAFAGGDLFSFILLHWVAGITFMLLVTVFLLQLREVAHPDMLARLIRPQEPQPDLLGNLMHETVLTHMKRMALSLAIYAPLLALHVTLPVILFHSSGVGRMITFFHLNFYHFLTPQLQIPLELITFHLSMLALLERHKNTIGGLQHSWMKFMCRRMGLTEHVLPRRVKGFELIGTKSVFVPDSDDGDIKVDSFFSQLAAKEKDIDTFVLANIDKVDPSSTVELGEQRLNGERVLSITVRSIALPRKTEDDGVFQLPTKIGRYRLSLETNIHYTQNAEELKVLFYREIQGDEIKRPPEGWDDLGAGGAYVQGRWAWAKERKSLIEESIAERIPFRTSSQERRSPILIAKMIILIILSWFAVIFTGLAILSCPLAVGRSFYHLLRIPSKYIHDPLAFCIGAGLFFPAISLLARNINDTDKSLYERYSHWLGRFRRPPAPKLIVVLEASLLWVFVAPLTLGISYEFAVVKSSKWFVMEEPFLDFKTIAISWFMGTIILNTWSFLLYSKFFTRRFWSNVGNGILEPPLNEDGNPNPNARNNNREDPNAEIGLIWQGRQGRVARFFKILRTLLLDWEWDKVDRTAVIDDFARPTTKEIASALVGSALSYQLALYAFMVVLRVRQGGFNFPLLGFVEVGMFRKSLFRVCMTLHVLFQIGSRSRSSIDRWFEAAHEAARDDRYLIGELLMNYNREKQTNN